MDEQDSQLNDGGLGRKYGIPLPSNYNALLNIYEQVHRVVLQMT